jgi:outer membrane lipoprotein-sorting protein
MAQRYQGVTDYTANFLKQEVVDGKLLPRENITLKFRKPFSVYMRWRMGPHEGREVLYVQGKYDGKLIGHEGGFFGFITLSLDPKGPRAMKGSRYPITEAGIGKIIDRVLTDVERADAQGALQFTEVGTGELFGRKVRQITILLPESPNQGYSAPKMKLWIDTENGLPIQAEFFDWDGRKVESYAYKDLKLNAGLTDLDFDRNKDMYDF